MYELSKAKLQNVKVSFFSWDWWQKRSKTSVDLSFNSYGNVWLTANSKYLGVGGGAGGHDLLIPATLCTHANVGVKIVIAAQLRVAVSCESDLKRDDLMVKTKRGLFLLRPNTQWCCFWSWSRWHATCIGVGVGFTTASSQTHTLAFLHVCACKPQRGGWNGHCRSF